MCGESVGLFRVDHLDPGSSPRVGNASSTPPRGNARPVHPRTRGEHLVFGRLVEFKRGSSARAGNTEHHRSSRREKAVHPRTRGEHRLRPNEVETRSGSSPHARGTLHQQPKVVRRRRFIPARAGNTRVRRYGRAGVSVHPRTRGEHSGQYRLARIGAGSSPHARGTLKAAFDSVVGGRFIPARAGNT